ncbi:C-type lectin-like [Cloeon dipterum]|uniref:C-type lectin-like n=1 Tax=Cloeon dipterum TaxID=197152 RepID=UPI0032209B3E
MMRVWSVSVAIFAVFLKAYATFDIQGLTPLGEPNVYFLSSFSETWEKAEEFCKNVTFELLNVETEAENDFILSLYNVTNRVWIGGTDAEAEIGSFYWTQSSQPFNYTDWHVGEPSGTSNTTGQTERCVLYYNRRGDVKWNDAPCENAYPFICEKVVP